MPMNVLVTGGGTVAPIDDVRFISNVSSGRFSAAITEACLTRGATVWHVHSPSALLPVVRQARFNLDADDPSAEFDRLERLRSRWREVRDRLSLVPLRDGTVAEYRLRLREVLSGHRIDVAFLAMAASDFEPVRKIGKIETPAESLMIRCAPTPKVIREVRDLAPDIYLVGFKLLSRAGESALIRAAEAAGTINRADLTVANDLQMLAPDGCRTVHLVRSGFPTETLAGEDTAERLVQRVFAWVSSCDRSGPLARAEAQTSPPA